MPRWDNVDVYGRHQGSVREGGPISMDEKVGGWSYRREEGGVIGTVVKGGGLLIGKKGEGSEGLQKGMRHREPSHGEVICF